MTDQQRKAIHNLIDYMDIVRGSVRFNFQDDGDIIAYPTPKITLSTDLSTEAIAKKTEVCYTIARIIKID
jgi:hypothetical protein